MKWRWRKLVIYGTVPMYTCFLSLFTLISCFLLLLFDLLDLCHPQLLIKAMHAHELGVCTTLNNMAVVQHNN